MIVRYVVRCSICAKEITIRASVGLEKTCTHTFDCPECLSELTLEIRAVPPNATIFCIENCETGNSAGKLLENPVINLHPSTALKQGEYHAEIVSPSIRYMKMLMPYLNRFNLDQRVIDAHDQFELPYAKELWLIISNIFTLVQRGDPANVIKGQIAKYVEKRQEFSSHFSCTTFFKCTASFFDSMFHPLIRDLRYPLRTFITDVRKLYPQEISNFETYYQATCEQSHLSRYISLFKDYFANFDQFRQMLGQARLGIEDYDDFVIGSKNFEQIKLYYGQAYETLTSSYITLACLNNIAQGRAYDTFLKMTLNKYIKDVEKAKKADPFRNEPVLAAFTQWEDSSLRNGSHHASIVRNGELINYRSGGTGKEQEISYSKYIYLCNAITIANAALMLVELQEFSTLKP